MGRGCKKVDLSSTQGAWCTVSIFFYFTFYLFGGCVRTQRTPTPAYGPVTSLCPVCNNNDVYTAKYPVNGWNYRRAITRRGHGWNPTKCHGVGDIWAQFSINRHSATTTAYMLVSLVARRWSLLAAKRAYLWRHRLRCTRRGDVAACGRLVLRLCSAKDDL